jgi:hypothetical protein
VTSNRVHNRIAEIFLGGWRNVLNIKFHTPHYFNKRFVGHNVRILVAFLSWCQIKKNFKTEVIIHHELGLHRPASVSSSSLVKGIQSRLRPFCL